LHKHNHSMAMYGGENETIIFNFETDNCTIVLNQTDGINFTFNGNEVLIEPAINFVGEFNITCYDWLTKETETQSSSGSGPAPKDWSAKCGYNKECLYGKQTNETEIVEVEEQEVIEDAPKPIIQEEKEGNYIYLALGILIIMAIFAIWWFNRDPNPVYVYDNMVV